MVFDALREGLLEKEEAKETLHQLVSKGFRIKLKLLLRILREVEGFTRRSR